MTIGSLKQSVLAGLVLLLVLCLFVVGCNKGEKEQEQAGSQETQGTAQQSQQQQQPPPGMGNMPAPATDVSDEELGVFSGLLAQTQAIQTSSQEDMHSAVTKTGMSLDRYMQIMQQMQGQGQGGTPPSISAEEQAQLEEAQKALQQIQMEAQQKMVAIVMESDMTIERFQSILVAMQSDPALQQRLQKYMQPSQP